MANITINEISQNYSYNIGNNSYCQVALPITSSWGPGYFDPNKYSDAIDAADFLESVAFQRFPATQAGLEAFVSTYRGPTSNYRLAKDFSYQMAMTLLSAGYDVLTCRVAPGDKARVVANPYVPQEVDESIVYVPDTSKSISIVAKYPGTFGNTLMVKLTPAKKSGVNLYWNLIVYVVDETGTRSAVENLSFVLNEDKSTDILPYVDEVESKFIDIVATGVADDGEDNNYHFEFNAELATAAQLSGGTDTFALPEYVALTAATTYRANAFFQLLADGSYALLTDENAPADFTTNFANYYVANAAVDTSASGKLSVEVVDTTFFGAVYNSGYADTYTFKYDGSDWKLGETTATLADYGIEVTGTPAANDGIVVSVRSEYLDMATKLAIIRYSDAYPGDDPATIEGKAYIQALKGLKDSTTDATTAKILAYREWIFNAGYLVYDILTDKLAYNNQRVISPGWDDQDILYITGEYASSGLTTISPYHIKLMNTAYYSRCAAAYLDIPRSLPRSKIYDEESEAGGYAQMLSRYQPAVGGYDINRAFYSTHSGLFVSWGQFKYAGTSKYNIAPPSFQALMIERGMILNQPAQYEWALPVNRHHQVSLGKLDFAVSKKYLDVWQKLEGVGVNVITNIPDMGISLWGNSTLYEVPPATYQALANLSTRKLVNAVADISYRCGIAITFQYNNAQAYSAFYAGVTPLLDTMKNVGAIDDYYVRMSADIDAEGAVQANSVIGTVYLVINGVINDITIDLVALPPATDLNQFRG